MKLNTYSNFILSLKNRYFLLFDILIFALTPFISVLIRLESLNEINKYFSSLLNIIPTYILLKLLIFYFFGLYKKLWRFASIEEYIRILYSGIFILFLQYSWTLLIEKYFESEIRLPHSIPIIDSFLTIGYFGLSRFSIRILETTRQKNNLSSRNKPVVIYGAGDMGVKLLKNLQSDKNSIYFPVAFIDDDERKSKSSIGEVAVEGNINNLEDVINRLNVKDVIIAIDNISGEIVRKVFEICKRTNAQTHILKEFDDEKKIQSTQKNLRNLRIEDLLKRDAVNVDLNSIKEYFKFKKVLVTGAGGSIGSEICRQLYKCIPSNFTIVGHGENSIFDIQNELLQLNSSIKLQSAIVDIRDKNRLDLILEKTKPDIIFHAAAHKHVPLMEENSFEAITNNIAGTLNLCELSIKHDVKNFVLISSDKAVNPTSIMGATKRVAELVVKNFAERYNKNFVAVRFGNVLDSRGSVIPTFKKQIENGGPITVTHPEIKRYFMTIKEAVTLVLQSSVLGKSGDTFLLDMGNPVKIKDLATDLIRLSGKDENSIEIVYTGLRPGEKLFEELLLNRETIHKTRIDKIFILNGSDKEKTLKTTEISDKDFLLFKNKIQDLVKVSAKFSNNEIRKELQKIVPELNGVK